MSNIHSSSSSYDNSNNSKKKSSLDSGRSAAWYRLSVHLQRHSMHVVTLISSTFQRGSIRPAELPQIRRLPQEPTARKFSVVRQLRRRQSASCLRRRIDQLDQLQDGVQSDQLRPDTSYQLSVAGSSWP